MDWDDLKYVLAVSRARSFQGAAKLLKVSHTTVGRRIAALEARLGTMMFDRKSNDCVPTRACMTMLESAERVESEIHAIRQNLKETGVTPEGTVRISTMHWIINHVLIPAMPSLLSEFPGIQMFFVGDLYDQIGYGREPGLSLRFEIQANKQELSRDVATLGYAVYARADYDVDELPWVSFEQGGNLFAPSAWLQRQGVPFHDIRMLGNDAAIIHRAIQAGVGKGLIPELIGEADPLLVRLSGDAPEIVRQLRIIIDPRITTIARVNAVLNWLEATFASLAVPKHPL